MAAVPSTMVPLGTPMPAFTLPDAHGTDHASPEVAGERGTLVMFVCNHCPFVRGIAEALAALGRDLPADGVEVVAINSNDFVAHPADAPDRMVVEAANWGWTFPYLVDADQDTARSFHAACTPDFFLYDADGRLVYRGQLDASRPGNATEPTGADIRAAVAALVAGDPPLDPQTPSIGCNIKWRPGSG